MQQNPASSVSLDEQNNNLFVYRNTAILKGHEFMSDTDAIRTPPWDQVLGTFPKVSSKSLLFFLEAACPGPNPVQPMPGKDAEGFGATDGQHKAGSS